MIRQRLIFFIGLWVALLPFLGFPKNFRTVLFVLTGFGLIAISYFMYIQTKAIKEESHNFDTPEVSTKSARKARKKKMKNEPVFSSEGVEISQTTEAPDTYNDQLVSLSETPTDSSIYNPEGEISETR